MVSSYRGLLQKINILKNATKLLKLVDGGSRYNDNETPGGDQLY